MKNDVCDGQRHETTDNPREGEDANPVPTTDYQIGDFYWDYADILRGGYGISETMYDQRVLALMALKLMCDNRKLNFSFDYRANFDQGLFDEKSTKKTLLQIVRNLTLFNRTSYFQQEKRFNVEESDETATESCLSYLNHPLVFDLTSYIAELDEVHLEMVLDIYMNKANFVGYPHHAFKDLYEQTVWRMKNSGKRSISGQLTGQHFTQKAIVRLMCMASMARIGDMQKIAVYDPACGTGSMLMESYFCFKEQLASREIKVFGQELNPQLWMLAKIFLEISEIPNVIACGNTLTKPAFKEGFGADGSFEFIVANPPFGVDWKHSYRQVQLEMESAEHSAYFVVKQDGKIILPKKSDGQFLFMLHIAKTIVDSRKRGSKAAAAIISSSSLLSSGGRQSSEALIRAALFSEGIVNAVLEQPKSMFTNTDIVTHIWFLDSFVAYETQGRPLKLIKADNGTDPHFVAHAYPRDKMKNTYNWGNLERLVYEIVEEGRSTPNSSKLLPFDDLCTANMAQEMSDISNKKHGAAPRSIADINGDLVAVAKSLAMELGIYNDVD